MQRPPPSLFHNYVMHLHLHTGDPSHSTHNHLCRGGGSSRSMAGMGLEDNDLLLGGAEDPSHHREDAAEADELIR